MSEMQQTISKDVHLVVHLGVTRGVEGQGRTWKCSPRFSPLTGEEDYFYKQHIYGNRGSSRWRIGFLGGKVIG
jgi:hypothetical protein